MVRMAMMTRRRQVLVAASKTFFVIVIVIVIVVMIMIVVIVTVTVTVTFVIMVFMIVIFVIVIVMDLAVTTTITNVVSTNGIPTLPTSRLTLIPSSPILCPLLSSFLRSSLHRFFFLQWWYS